MGCVISGGIEVYHFNRMGCVMWDRMGCVISGCITCIGFVIWIGWGMSFG